MAAPDVDSRARAARGWWRTGRRRSAAGGRGAAPRPPTRPSRPRPADPRTRRWGSACAQASELVDELAGVERAALGGEHVVAVARRAGSRRRRSAIADAAPGPSPVRSIPSDSSSSAARFGRSGRPSPPSSATRATGRPRSSSDVGGGGAHAPAHSMASAKELAPTGMASKSWTSSARAAWAPPEMMFTIGSGSRGAAPSSRRLPRAAGAAGRPPREHVAIETASTALAPRRPRSVVPSTRTARRRGRPGPPRRARGPRRRARRSRRHGLRTPRPPYRSPPSRSSCASWRRWRRPTARWPRPWRRPRGAPRSRRSGVPRESSASQASTSVIVVSLMRAAPRRR